MVVASQLAPKLSPGRLVLEQHEHALRSKAQQDEPELALPKPDAGSLLQELLDLNAGEASSGIQQHLYSSRVSLQDPPCAEEELAWHGAKVVWSKGTAVFRSFIFDRHGLAGHVAQALFAWFVPPSVSEAPVASTSNLAAASAVDRTKLFGPFASSSPPPWTDEQRFGKSILRPEQSQVQRALCIFLRDVLFIHFVDSGRDYYVHLPFKFKQAWPLKRGLLVERQIEGKELGADSTLATLYSLSDPLDEFRIVAAVASCTSPATPDHRAPSTPFVSPAEEALLLARRDNEAPLLVTYDAHQAKLHLYAYIFVPENEARSEAEKRKASIPAHPISNAQSGAKGKGRASIVAPSSPTHLMERTRSKMSMTGGAADTSAIGRRLREGPRASTAARGAGDMDRMALGEQHEMDNAMIRQASEGEALAEGQPMRSEVYLARLGEHQLDPSLAQQLTNTGEELKMVLFDSRLPSCLLAVHLVKRQQLRILWLDVNRPGLVARASDAMPASSIAPVLATRPDIYDLLYSAASGQGANLLTADCYSISINLGAAASSDGFTDVCEDRVSLGDRRFSTRQWPRSALVQRCLEALSFVTSTSCFLQVLTNFLDQRQASPSTTEWDAFSSSVQFMFGVVGQTDKEVAFQSLLKQRRADVAFAGISPALEPVSLQKVAPPRQLSLQDKQAILVSLHLTAEDLKLVASRSTDCGSLLPLLAQLSHTLGLAEWLDYYRRSGFNASLPPLTAATAMASMPFDIMHTLHDILAANTAAQWPDLRHLSGSTNSRFYGAVDPAPLLRQCIELFTILRSDNRVRCHAVVERIYRLGWTAEDVSSLSLGIRLPLMEAIRQAQYSAAPDWPVAAYELIGRDDLARTAAAAEGVQLRKKAAAWLPMLVSRQRSAVIRRKDDSAGSHDDESPRSLLAQLDINSAHRKPAAPARAQQFSQDLRLEEVGRMLQTWKQVTVRLPDRPDLGEHAIASEHAALATHLASRTLALPIGAAMFTFRTEKKRATEAFRVNAITLAAKVMPQGSLITPDNNAVPADKKIWADFHCGVGSALRLAAEPGEVDFSDISFNKPDNLDARFGGLLMGLGLSGHIRAMASFQAFAYLDPKHEQTSIGLLLGLAASFVSTCDPKVTSVLSVHLSAMHPSDSTGLNVSQATQAAGMLSLGLLYLGRQRRRLADICVRELAQTKVVPLEGPETCREAYTLALGFAFGFIMLGAGKTQKDVLDAPTLRTMRNLITGEGLHDLPSTKNSMSTATDVALTSPAATVALALVYLDSGRQDIADLLEIPTANEHFDYVRPDLILLRTLARGMIMRGSIKSSTAWVESLVPDFILKAKRMGRGGRAGSVDIDLAYWCIVAGGLMAMALRYAGTADGEVHATMIHYFDGVRRFGQLKDPTIQGRFLRRGVRSCANVICMSLAIVMAGTGELNVLRRIRVLHGQIGEQWDFGTHLATHMSLGLLFLGGGSYTLSSSPAATAVLLCALYPALPSHSGDNRSHVQAARHLWVLAVEPRRLIARDVDTDETVFLPVRVRVHEEGNLRSQKLVTPTLIPEMSSVESVRVDSPRYMPSRLMLSGNSVHRASFVRTRTLFVKRCGGYLDYARDPKGVQSLFSRSRAEAGSHVFDFGKVAELLGSRNDGSLAQFASDTLTRGAVKYLCRSDGPASSRFEAFVSSIVTEALSNDKPSALGSYLGFWLASRADMDASEGVLSRQQLQMAFGFYADHLLEACLPPSSHSHSQLVGPAFIGHLSMLLQPVLAADARQVVVAYLRQGVWPDSPASQAALVECLVATDAPDVDVIGKLSNVAGGAKGSSEGEVVLRKVLEQVLGRAPHELLVEVMREAWL